MKLRSRCSAAVLAIALGSIAGPAAADFLKEGQTASGYRFVVGGVGEAEQQALKQIADKYSLQIVMALRTGSYVADAAVQISDQNGNVVMESNVDAPWLMVDVPPGRYTVKASVSGQQVQRQVNVSANESQRIYLHFNAAEHPAPISTDAPAARSGSASR